MKKITLLTGILLIFCTVQAQDTISVGQIIDLHYKARKAEQANNTQEALEIYKTILAIDASLPIPYLKMADIYAADENNAESAATAIVLYYKYLSLQPNDEDAPAIKDKIAQLQKNTAGKQNVDLANVLHINQAQTQHVVETKARRGKIPANKQELEQQVGETTLLYERTQEAISTNNDTAGTQYAEQLLEQTDPGNPLTVQMSMMLAEMHGKQGNMQKMSSQLAALEEDVAMYKQMQQYYTTTIKDAQPFEDDICGIWVSDLAYNDATPFLAIKIEKELPEEYKATILPYCMLAEKHNMYTGKPFGYTAKYSENTKGHFAYSAVDAVHQNTDMAYFYFGNRKFLGTSEGVDEFIIKPVGSFVGEVAKGAAEYVATDLDRTYTDAQLTSLGIELAGALVQWGISQLTVKKTTEIGLELNVQRLFAGCADINLVHNVFITKTDGYTRESADSMQMRMYKLYPEDNILFAAAGNELFGHKIFSKDETLQTEEYEHLQALKSRDYFNRQAYKKLSEKVSDFCFAKAVENPDFESMAYDCRTRFEYGSKGFSYRTFENGYGRFEGWVDVSGKMNGVGKCTLNDGTTYVGSWENNKYSGEGKITFQNKETVMQEYTGTFKNNKYHGKGLLYKGAIIYEGDFSNGVFEGTGMLTDVNESTYNGTWKNDAPVKGSIIYTNGDFYEGQCTYNKKTQQLERNGIGAMLYADGEMISGKWNNNELTIKK